VSSPQKICEGAGGITVEVVAGVEVAITVTTTTLSMRQPLRVQCNTVIIHRHHTTMGGVVALMITPTALPHTLPVHPHNINTGRGTDRAVPGHTHRRPPRTAGAPLTRRTAVGETHRDPIIIGADITLGPRAEAEADTVEVAADTMAGPVAGVEMIMETAAEEDLEIVCLRTATIPAPTMAATALAAVARCEDVVGAEVTEY